MIRALTLLTLSLLTARVSATTVESYLRNREGVKKFAEKAYYPAYQAFLRALEEEPMSPEVQMNLARVFEANEEYEKAEKAYKGALRLLESQPVHRFEVMFNLAGVLGKEEKIPEALEYYQKCLDMDPESKEVKTNIELLFQGGGGGQGKNKDDKSKDGKDQKDKKDPKDGDQKDQQPQQQDQKDQKKQPKPFQSEDLSAQDVKKILDEIKNQEQSIRAQEYERNGKEQGNAKDW